MPRQIEPNANNALGRLLQGMMPGCQVLSETTQTFTAHPGRHADVLVTAQGRSPVAVEAEYLPAPEAEQDARARLGLSVTGQPRAIEAAIALRYPETVEYADDVTQAVADARLSYCVLHEDGSRFPESGWLEGSVPDIADLVSLVSLPQKVVDDAARILEKGIGRAANQLEEMSKLRPGITTNIARLLGMIDVPQTRRMACAILANAMIFHQRIAGIHEDIRPLAQVCGREVANPQDETLAAWTEILDINYWPIFAIAKDILEQLPGSAATAILRELHETAQKVESAGVDNAHNLSGRVFQRLIADRKYLATFYTLPESAALLARLAVDKMDGVDWSDADAIGKLRIGDFACGTGALLSAVYEQVVNRHERVGGHPAALHRVIMEEVLYGCDVMPSAVHITGSTLSGMQPNVGFSQSRLYPLAYGRQPDGTVNIGSLELLQGSVAMTLFNTHDPARRTGSIGEETAAHIIVDVPDDGFDLVIMNPPFTRATNHEGAHADITNPAFAAFDATPGDQTAMGGRINQFGKDSCYHGNAGIASAFAALADKKLKPGGVLALVLPLSVAAGLSWQGLRAMLAQGYTDLIVLSIAASDNDHLSFSADTGMAECLVIARKLNKAEATMGRAHFISLSRRSQGLAHSGSIAMNVTSPDQARRIEDGPYGGTALMVGDELAGDSMTARSHADGSAWGAVRLSDLSLAQTAHALAESNLWLPGSFSAAELKTTPLNVVSQLGMVHRDIIGPPPRGPFDKVAPSPTATYPAMWNHDAKNETRIVCAPDSQLQVRQGMEVKAATVWSTASRAHLNLDFRFNSQPLAAALTERESMGGRAWPNVKFPDGRFDYAFALWCNCTLGLLSFWWHSNRQHSGRGTTTIRSAESLPILDFRALTHKHLAKAEEILPSSGTRSYSRPTWPTPTPTGPCWTGGWSATCWASTRAFIRECGGWRPNGAPSRRFTGASNGPGA